MNTCTMTNDSDLYSDNDDEFETHTSEDEYSPTDGYFNDRDHPRDVFVQSPTTSHTKEQEAAEESQSHTPPSSSSNVAHEYRTPSSPIRSEPDEATPLLFDAPPPAYSANSSEAPVINTPTTLLFSDREPESMGVPSEQFDAERNGFIRPQRSRSSRMFSGLFKLALALIAIVVLVCIFAQAFTDGWNGRQVRKLNSSSGESNADGQQQEPSEKDPEMPSMPKWPAQCAWGSHKSVSYDFSTLSSFTFDENLRTNALSGGIYGRVRLAAAPESQTAPIRVNVSLAPSAPYSIEELHVLKTANGIMIKDPDLKRDISPPAYRKPCMIVGATIYFKEDVTLSKLYVNTRNLDIDFTLTFKATMDETLLRTEFANIRSEARFNSRETRINAGSSSISGHYNLLDLLSVTTQSGSINVDVTPKEASKDDKPARLECVSRSGSISVQMPPRDSFSELPERDYQTIVKTQQGSISGRLVHGTSTVVESQSGSLAFDLLPYSASDESTLKTHSQSGMTQVNVASPHTGSTMKHMTSSHTTGSGSLHLTYPQAWEGKISGGTNSGSITLRGRDVVTDEYNAARHYVRAHKGKGHLDGKLDFGTGSGSVDITIGDM